MHKIRKEFETKLPVTIDTIVFKTQVYCVCHGKMKTAKQKRSQNFRRKLL